MGAWGNTVSISSIYQSLRTHSPAPPWLPFVWHKFRITKHSFTAWLIMKERLLTKDRMYNFHMNVDQTCLLCGAANETHQNLFCECSFTRSLLIASPLSISSVWHDIRNGHIINGSADLLRTNITYLYVPAAFYHVWAERNFRLYHPGQFSSANTLIWRIKEDMRNRLLTCTAFTKAACQDTSLISFIY